MKWRIAVLVILFFIISGAGFFLIREGGLLLMNMVTEAREDVSSMWEAVQEDFSPENIDFSLDLSFDFSRTELWSDLREKAAGYTADLKEIEIPSFQASDKIPEFIENYLREPLEELRQNFIEDLKQELDLELVFQEVDYWPLNEIVFHDIEIGWEGNVLTADELAVSYNFLDLLRAPDNWLHEINYIALKGPDLQPVSDTGENFFSESGEDDILSRLGSLNIYIKDGRLNYHLHQKEVQSQILLTNTEGIIEIRDREVDINLGSSLVLDNFAYNDLEISHLSLDNISFNFALHNEGWEGVFALESAAVDLVADIIAEEEFIIGDSIQVTDLKGTTDLRFLLRVSGFEASEYRGTAEFQQVGLNFSYRDSIDSHSLEDIQGRLLFDSGLETAILENIDLIYQNNRLNLEGAVREIFSDKPRYSINLATENLVLGERGLQLENYGLFEIRGTGEMELYLQGLIENPDIHLTADLNQVLIRDEQVDSLELEMLYKDNLVFLEYMNLYRGVDSHAFLEGVYRPRTQEYSFSVSGNSLQLDFFKDYTGNDYLQQLDGKADLDLKLTGKQMNLENMMVMGDVNIYDIKGLKHPVQEASTDLLFSENSLYFSAGEVSTPRGDILFDGTLNTGDQKWNIDFRSSEMDIALVEYYLDNNNLSWFEVNSLEGSPSFSGQLKGAWNQPRVTMDIDLSRGYYNEHRIEDLTANIVYEQQKVEVKKMGFYWSECHVSGEGWINTADTGNQIEAVLSLSDLKYSNIQELMGINIPAAGHFDMDLKVSGEPDNPLIEGEVYSAETILIFGENYEIDDLQFSFLSSRDKVFEINKFEALKKNTVLQGTGLYTEEMITGNFKLDNFAPGDYINQYDLQGTVQARGELEGTLDNPEIDFELNSEELKYENISVKSISGTGLYKADEITVQQLEGRFGGGEYNVEGEIHSLSDIPELFLDMRTENGNLNSFVRLLDIDLFFQDFQNDFLLVGEAQLRGPWNEPRAELDFRGGEGRSELPADEEQSKERGAEIIIQGSIGRELGLDINGDNLYIEHHLALEGGEVPVSGRANFSGRVNGDIREPNLNIESEINDINFMQFNIPLIKGNLQLNSDRTLSVEQSIDFDEDRKLDITGDVHLADIQELNFEVNLDRVPLNFLAGEMEELKIFEGDLTGSIKLTGTRREPQLEGLVELEGRDMELGFPETVSQLEGVMRFSEQAIIFEDFLGVYGEEEVNLSGQINIFDFDDFWDLVLYGQNIPFARGSYEGLIDPDITISGSFYRPVFAGDITTKNFTVSTPFDWPTDESETIFSPAVDINIYPGSEVYFTSNDRLRILVEEGSINLQYYEGDVSIDGNLSSTEGTFAYYNNRFNLQEASANFQRHLDYIPRIHARASTVVDGNRIYAVVSGPADNMQTSFESQPPLAEDEILSLLVRRGGLGEFAEEDPSIMQAINREFIRFLQETFQLDFVERVAGDVREYLELDTFTIDAYDIGLDNRVDVIMGKDLSDRLYMEYSASITPDYREDEFSFKYRLGANTYLDGTWYGDDEYRISLETIIEF